MKNKTTNCVLVMFLILFFLPQKLFSQDWVVTIGDDFKGENNWKMKFGRFLTSESQLTNSSQRLLRNTRYKRVPVGLYGWGSQAIFKSSNLTTIFDITSDRNSYVKDSFRGLETGFRIQYQFDEGWFLGSNCSYSFSHNQKFFATDFGYRGSDWDVRLVSYLLDDDIQGGFIFAQYRFLNWLYLDAGLDYRSDRESLEKLLGLRFHFEEKNTDFTIDYIYEGNEKKNETIRGRFSWKF